MDQEIIHQVKRSAEAIQKSVKEGVNHKILLNNDIITYFKENESEYFEIYLKPYIFSLKEDEDITSQV